jgi:transposase-like protein
MRTIEAGTTSEKKWTELIRQQQQSGLSVSAFCRDHGFSDQAFYYWRKRFPAMSRCDSLWLQPMRQQAPTMRR